MSDQPRSTRALLGLLGRRGPGPALDVGSWQGAVALAAGCGYLNANLVACEEARAAGVSAVLHTDELPAEMYGTVWFDAREYDPGLAAETVAQVAARLLPDGVLLTTARRSDLEACFDLVEELGEALVASRPRAGCVGPEWPVYVAEFQGQAFRIRSAPGLFSPRGLDAGTAFMLEQIGTPEPGARFLDLGCGAGVVSRIATDVWGCTVTAVDVNARALRLTALNAPKAEVIASDGLAALTGRSFDIIASNPPYHTDFGVAKAFIEGAFSHLAIGGTLYLVVKRADWYIQKVRAVFGGARVAERDGYTVIAAERREARPRVAAPTAPPTTKKHARRMAEASAHKRKRK